MTPPLARQRVTLITLGVRDMARTTGFYRALGWQPQQATDQMACFQLLGQALMLFGHDALAEDQGRAGTTLGTGAMTLAQTFPSRADVDAAFALAISAGATALKPPQDVFWGGYSGYVADPDGHVWEYAHNPFWPLNPDGSLTLPAPEEGPSPA
ncbi:MAG: VOC family protein [Roseinatronobacter sp.]